MSRKKKTKRPKAKASQYVPKKSSLHHSLYQAARRFIEYQPWDFLDGEDAFAVRVPGEPHPLAVCILGAAGEEFGFSIIRGPSSAGQLLSINRGEDIDPSGLDMMSMSIDSYKRIPDELRRFYKRAGVKPSASVEVPLFFIKPPYQVVREPKTEEVEMMLYVINGAIDAIGRGVLTKGGTIKTGGLLTLNLSGDPLSPVIEIEGVDTLPKIEEQAAPSLLVDVENLKQLPALDETWIITCRRMPIRIKNVADEMRVVIVMDEATELIRDVKLVQGAQALVQASHHLVELMFGKKNGGASPGKPKPGRPRSVVFTEENFHTIMEAVLLGACVECELAEDIPLPMQEAVDGLVEHLGRGSK